MFTYQITTWTGAVLNAAWTYFVLFFITFVVFLAIEPGPEYNAPLSSGAGVLAGWLVGADLVWTVNRVEGLRPSTRSRVIGFFVAVPSAVIFTWASLAHIADSPIFVNVPMVFLPTAIMAVVLFLAGAAIKG